MSQRQFLSTLIWLVLVNLVIKALFIFGIDLQVQKQVGQEIYGHYFALLNLCYIFQIINDFGLQFLHGTDTARHGYVRRGHWATILRLKIFLSLAYVLIVWMVASALGIIFSWEILLGLVISNILISWIAVLRAGISGMAHYKTEAMISVLDKVFMILICGFLFLTLSHFRMEWFVWAQAASFALTAIFALIMSIRINKYEPADPQPGEASVMITFKDAMPFCLAVLLMYAYTRSDAILLTRLLPDGAHAAGVYAASFRLLDAANMIAILVTPLLIPMYARLHNDRKETIHLIHLAAGLMIFMTFSVSVASFWWNKEIMVLCYGQEEAQWVTTFQWLILSHIPIGLMYVYGSYLTALRLMKSQNILYSCMVVLNIGLNILWIPSMSTIGAAIAAVITQTITTAVLIWFVYRHLKLKPDGRWVRNVVIYILTAVLYGWALQKSGLQWIAGVSIFLLLSIGSAFMLKLLDRKKLLALLRNAE